MRLIGLDLTRRQRECGHCYWERKPRRKPKACSELQLLTETIAMVIADGLPVKTRHSLVLRITSITSQMFTGWCFEMGCRDYHYVLDVLNVSSRWLTSFGIHQLPRGGVSIRVIGEANTADPGPRWEPRFFSWFPLHPSLWYGRIMSQQHQLGKKHLPLRWALFLCNFAMAWWEYGALY